MVIQKALPAMIALFISTLACSIFLGGPVYPDTPIPVSTGTSQDLQAYVLQAVTADAQTGTITLQITQDQLTTYLQTKIDAQTDPLITDPVVSLRDGQMIVYGKVQRSAFTANISVTTRVSIDPNGQPKIEITKTDLGPLPAPQGLNDAISSFVTEAFTGAVGPIATGFRLESISITDGLMTVTGRVK